MFLEPLAIVIAYEAYHKEAHNDLNLEAQKAFFEAYTKTLCTNYAFEKVINEIMVYGTLKSFEQFSTAYNCSIDDTYYDDTFKCNAYAHNFTNGNFLC